LAENQDGHLEATKTLGIKSTEPYTRITSEIKGIPWSEPLRNSSINYCCTSERAD
jgi:hypothetical protein